jgi:hypothetical protein
LEHSQRTTIQRLLTEHQTKLQRFVSDAR